MFKLPVATAAILSLAVPALAESHASADGEMEITASGDAAAGEEAFNRQCISCHVVANEDGEVLAGRKAKTGPNLYGIVGQTIGTVPDFRYGKSIVEVGEAGHVWNEENFVGYAQDPRQWLRDTLDDKRARSKMTWKVRSEEDAHNIFAFLLSVAPPEDAEAPATN